MMHRLWPFVLGSVALGLDAYVVAGLLPFIATSLGAKEATVGLGVAAFTGSYAIVGPLAGRTSWAEVTEQPSRGFAGVYCGELGYGAFADSGILSGHSCGGWCSSRRLLAAVVRSRRRNRGTATSRERGGAGACWIGGRYCVRRPSWLGPGAAVGLASCDPVDRDHRWRSAGRHRAAWR